VKVRQQHIELLVGYKPQCIVHIGGDHDFKAAAFQAFLEDLADVIIIINEKNPLFIRIHSAPTFDG
jgi:hypothetical protein